MLAGAVLSAASVLLLVSARSPAQMFLFGGLMSLGSGAFTSANWALTSDVIPADEAARFMALANFGTAGATAAAGLFGILFDAAEASFAGSGYSILFTLSAASFAASALAVRGIHKQVDAVTGASY
jgi:MFS family permease